MSTALCLSSSRVVCSTISTDGQRCIGRSDDPNNFRFMTVKKIEISDNRLTREADTDSSYGKELILDLHDCDTSRFTRHSIEQFCSELCELIDMEPCDLHFWDDLDVPEEEQQTHPKTKGTSVVQFILTSTIVIHTLVLMKAAYANIFSCKEFDTDAAAKFTAKWFRSTDWTFQVVTRR